MHDQAEKYERELAEAQEHKKALEANFEKVIKVEEERLMEAKKE